MTPTEEGLDFILSHFKEPKWPRSISTKTTEYRQVLVNNGDEALARFKQAKYLDCRISAYGPNADENPSAVARFQGLRTATPANIVVMMDLDRCNFKSERALGLALSVTLKNIRKTLSVDTLPSVLWSGRGYHIIQPLDADGIILENIKEFGNIQQISVKFLRFAEWFLSNGKFLSNGMSDPSHNITVSFGNMMLRVPGSINSKNGQTVKIIQKWDEHRPKINYLLRDFRHWLIDQRIHGLLEEESKPKKNSHSLDVGGTENIGYCDNIWWIDKLLETPIHDHRKFTVWRILSPYLMNVKKIPYDDAYYII